MQAIEWITFKLCFLVYKTMCGLADYYMHQLYVHATTIAMLIALHSTAFDNLTSPTR